MLAIFAPLPGSRSAAAEALTLAAGADVSGSGAGRGRVTVGAVSATRPGGSFRSHAARPEASSSAMTKWYCMTVPSVYRGHGAIAGDAHVGDRARIVRNAV